jgi:hypothetical protein
MELAAKIDDLGKPAWIVLMVLGFIFFWPIGLALLAYLLWSGRMGCSHRAPGRWHNERANWREHWRESMRHWGPQRTSGNRAFDEYREDVLRRLEDEQKEFRDFLQRLRHARDKHEFDQFMDERRNRRDEPPAPDAAGSPAPQPQG